MLIKSGMFFAFSNSSISIRNIEPPQRNIHAEDACEGAQALRVAIVVVAHVFDDLVLQVLGLDVLHESEEEALAGVALRGNVAEVVHVPGEGAGVGEAAGGQHEKDHEEGVDLLRDLLVIGERAAEVALGDHYEVQGDGVDDEETDVFKGVVNAEAPEEDEHGRDGVE